HVVLRRFPGPAAIARAHGHGARVAAVAAEHIVADRIAAGVGDVAGREVGDQRAVGRLPETAGERPRAELILPPVDDGMIDLAWRPRRGVAYGQGSAPRQRT